MVAALNSIEMVTVPGWFLEVSGEKDNGLAGWMGKRLDQLERVLRGREWPAADRFTAADLLMADCRRGQNTDDGPCRPPLRGDGGQTQCDLAAKCASWSARALRNAGRSVTRAT